MIKLHDETHHINETSMITLHDTFWKKICIQKEIPKRNHSNDKDGRFVGSVGVDKKNLPEEAWL